jgi:Holliday junction resolvasome RuvABC endonuclease subunit
MVEIVAVEDQFYLSNFKSVLKLGQVKGVVILTVHGLAYRLLNTALGHQSAVTGYGRAERASQMMVEKLLLASPPEPLDLQTLAVALPLLRQPKPKCKAALVAALDWASPC